MPRPRGVTSRTVGEAAFVTGNVCGSIPACGAGGSAEGSGVSRCGAAGCAYIVGAEGDADGTSGGGEDGAVLRGAGGGCGGGCGGCGGWTTGCGGGVATCIPRCVPAGTLGMPRAVIGAGAISSRSVGFGAGGMPFAVAAGDGSGSSVSVGCWLPISPARGFESRSVPGSIISVFALGGAGGITTTGLRPVVRAGGGPVGAPRSVLRPAGLTGLMPDFVMRASGCVDGGVGVRSLTRSIVVFVSPRLTEYSPARGATWL